MTVISTQYFDYHKDRVFTSELSTIEGNFGPLGNSFDMRSEKTGGVVRFFAQEPQYDVEGDLIALRYYSEYLPSLGGRCTVMIFND